MEINDLTYAIIGSAMRVHSALGTGFQEVIYQRSLEVEFEFSGIPFEREKEMDIFYRNAKVGSRRVDFLVNGSIMVELKATETLLPVHYTQAINYCEAYAVPHGLLINFGSIKLEFKRVINKKALDAPTS